MFLYKNLYESWKWVEENRSLVAIATVIFSFVGLLEYEWG